MIKVGQIYKEVNNEIYVISRIADKDCFVIYNDGYTACYEIKFIYDTLIAEYPTWQEAVNSKEFKVDGK